MAMVMGCLAPDVFSGVGIAAGPTVGTTAFQISSVATDLSRGTGTCLSLAGTHVASFDTQLVGVIAGTNDYTVAQGYADLNADIFAGIYGDLAGAELGTAGFAVTALEGYQPRGTGTLYSDADGPRVSLVKATGMGHAWPAGTGPGGEIAFVASEGVDYGWTLQDFFARNSRRTLPTEPIPGDDEPPVDEPPVEEPPDEEPPDGDLCEDWVEASEDDINGHLSRYDVYPPGYGVVDVTYVDLLDTHGVFGLFTLYLGVDGDWYHDPAEVPPSGDCP
jgi:poly(3-hydroxybutyrate) depolymerase